jgi:hypothetical protein
LADERGQAAVLRHNGHVHDAELLERVCARVAQAARDYLLWLGEPDAALWSGKSAAWLRSRFEEWREHGNAEMRGRVRHYRAICLPRRLDLDAAREAGRRGERVA